MMRILQITAMIVAVAVGSALQGVSANLQSLYEQGAEAFKSGNYGSSELLFRKIIEQDDSSEYRERAWYYLALSIYNQKKYKAAIFEFNRFLLICSVQDLCSESRYWIAESYFNLKDYIRAIEEYKRFIGLSKNNELVVTALDRIAEIYILQGRYDEAVIEWKKAIALNADAARDSLRIVKIGEALYLNENYDEALDLLENLLNAKMDKAIESRARLILGKIYQNKNRHRDALRALSGIPETLLKSAPFFDAQYYKAVSAIALGDTYSAKTYLESFLLIGKDSDWYYNAKYELGSILINENNEKRGVELLEDVRASTRKMGLRSRAALILSKLYLRQNPADAIPYLEDAVSLDDPQEQKNVLLLLSRVYVDVGRFDDAERILNLLATTYSDYEDSDLIQFLGARIALERGETDKAIAGFNRVREINPSSQYLRESLYYLSLAHISKKEDIQAIELLKKYISVPGAEKRYDAGVRLLQLYLKANDTRNAEKTMAAILAAHSRQEGIDELLFTFAESLQERGFDGSRYFKIIVNSYPKSPAAGRVMMIWAAEKFQKKDYAQAEYYYRMYLSVETRPDRDSVILFRARCLYNLGKHREILSFVPEVRPEIADAEVAKQLTFILGRSYYYTGDLEKAYGALFTDPLSSYAPEDLLIIEKCALAVGDIWTAQAAPSQIEKKDDLYAESLYLLGQYYAENKNNEASIGFFNKILDDAPNSSWAELAKVEMAGILIDEKRYAESIELLRSIRGSSKQDVKNALLIIASFRMGKINDATELSRVNIKRLLALPQGETVALDNLMHYYLVGDLKNFNVYAAYVQKYPGRAQLVNYLSGKLYFEAGQYAASYYYFYRVSQARNDYREEALYYLGGISLFHQKNAGLAMKYFQKLADEGASGSVYVVRAKINLAILLSESGNGKKAGDILNDIRTAPDAMLQKIQADNLSAYYGYPPQEQ